MTTSIRSWILVGATLAALSVVACGSDVEEPAAIQSSGGTPSVATGGTSNTGGGSSADGGAGTGAGGGSTSGGGSHSTGGTGPEPDCYEHPKTHHEIINACTTATKVEKHPDLARLNPDGSLPTP